MRAGCYTYTTDEKNTVYLLGAGHLTPQGLFRLTHLPADLMLSLPSQLRRIPLCAHPRLITCWSAKGIQAVSPPAVVNRAPSTRLSPVGESFGHVPSAIAQSCGRLIFSFLRILRAALRAADRPVFPPAVHRGIRFSRSPALLARCFVYRRLGWGHWSFQSCGLYRWLK